jgi:site-specific DNA recombinase
MLRNTSYVGTKYDGKTHVLPGKRNPDKNTRHAWTPQDEWIAISIPPIIEQATFEAAQARASLNKQQSRRNRKHEYLLTGGLLRCGQCGAAMSGEVNPQGYRRYRCNRGRLGYMDVIAPHTQRRVQATGIESQVLDRVKRAIEDPAEIKAEAERRRTRTSAQQAALDRDRQNYMRQLAKCDFELNQSWNAYIENVITLDFFKGVKATIDARRASAEQEIALLDAQQRFIEQEELQTVSLEVLCAHVRTELQSFNIEEKRRALEALNTIAIWRPGEPLEISLNIPSGTLSRTPCATPFPA